jgi:hypothetical protein
MTPLREPRGVAAETAQREADEAMDARFEREWEREKRYFADGIPLPPEVLEQQEVGRA